MLLRTALFAAVAVVAVLGHTDTDHLADHVVLQINPDTPEQQRALHEYLQNHPMLDVWFETRLEGVPVEVSASPEQRQDLMRFLDEVGIERNVAIHDLHSLIRNETLRASRSVAADDEAIDWKQYHRLEKIYEWMEDLQKNNPETVRVVNIGKSHEGRDMKGLVITFSPDLPVVMLESGIHAREWIAPASATYFIDQILQSDKNDIVRKFEWHLFPSVNPDGYVYTWEKNRSWRKTRSTHWLIFKGVDANRNWPYHWQDVGTNTIVYSEHYAGPTAESEVETRNLRQYVDNLVPRMRLYLSLHAYGQMLMFPWSYTYELTKRHAHLDEIAKKAVEAIKSKSGMDYKHGAIAKTIYTATGSTIDYVYSKCVPYTYVFEMRPQFSSRDTGEEAGNHGQQGFILPEEQIEETAAEVWAGTRVLLQEVYKYPSGDNPKTCNQL